MFEREDWTLFRSLATLGQKAGVPAERLPMLVAKELADNALDAGGRCRVVLSLGSNGFRVEDDGAGIPGDDDAIARLFSVRRPLVSSKVLRLPTRGALGNGLRVVAGAVLASGGELTVSTRGRTLRLEPRDDTGETAARRVGDHEAPGTVVAVRFGDSLPIDPHTLDWATRACRLAGVRPIYAGRSSPHWYDADAFVELLRAAGERTVRELVAQLDGCAEPKAGRIAADFPGRLARDLDRPEAERLLARAREAARPVSPTRLEGVGPRVDGFPAIYKKAAGTFARRSARGGLDAVLPYVVEAWAEVADEPDLEVYVNRTPIAAEASLHHGKQERGWSSWVIGCGLKHYVAEGRRPFRLRLNVQTPYMPITSDGKAPDLLPLLDPIRETLGRAARRARGLVAAPRPDEPASIKDIIVGHLPEAAAKAGGGGAFRFSLRQLFYAVRPFVIEALGKEPEYDYFASVITDHEAEHGEIPGMYRDPRGTLYHPHTGEEIPLGTLSVERYRRPEWTFNKVLYCEKEGFFPILREVGWPERHDCALMSSKGYASRAARDVLDLLGDTGEDLFFYCIHDADAYGTTIFQALQAETAARPGRRVHIVNLGLEPGEALAMGLQVEAVSRKGERAAPVADYVEGEWREWLQSRRVELNAMTTPQFLAWLDRKFADQVGKVVPPAEVLVERLRRDTRDELSRRITARILRRARVGERVEAALARRLPAIEARAATIRDEVERSLADEPSEPWGEPIRREAVIAAGRDPAVEPMR